ncbi:hypothetical protein [Marinobacterium jannaschii]|uniref:hypothetical protein n=1 Tax=Marinobacterium jannaschii TaxID=64970 RepID=UPI0004807AC3|nr:hypothetical protein [Marinobacterium jannaschii]
MGINKNYIFQGGALALPFVFSPFIFKFYGGAVFGKYSLVMSWATMLSYLLTMRSEVIIGKLNLVEDVREKFSVCLTILLYTSLIGSVLVVFFYETIDLLVAVLLLSVCLGLFNIVNYYLIVKDEFAFSKIQFLKNFVLYCMFGMVFFIDSSVEGMLFSAMIAFVLCAVLGGERYGVFREYLVLSNVAKVNDALRIGFPYVLTSLSAGARELVIVTFINFQFGAYAAGLYYICMMYLVKAFVAYSTIQANNIKYSLNRGVIGSVSGVFLGVVIKGVAILFIVCFMVFLTYRVLDFEPVDLELLLAILPCTLVYVVLMPVTVVYETHDLGRLNLVFNMMALFGAVLSCFFVYMLSLSLSFFLLIGSLVWLSVIFIQALVGVRCIAYGEA